MLRVLIKISRVSWNLEAARLCLKILQLSTFKYDTRGLARCCCAACQIFKRLENLKYQSHAFCYWLKINNTLRYCCFTVISDHILYGPPKGYTDHPVIHHGWSVGRPRICDFGQHWNCLMILNKSSDILQDHLGNMSDRPMTFREHWYLSICHVVKHVLLLC